MKKPTAILLCASLIFGGSAGIAGETDGIKDEIRRSVGFLEKIQRFDRLDGTLLVAAGGTAATTLGLTAAWAGNQSASVTAENAIRALLRDRVSDLLNRPGTRTVVYEAVWWRKVADDDPVWKSLNGRNGRGYGAPNPKGNGFEVMVRYRDGKGWAPTYTKTSSFYVVDETAAGLAARMEKAGRLAGEYSGWAKVGGVITVGILVYVLYRIFKEQDARVTSSDVEARRVEMALAYDVSDVDWESPDAELPEGLVLLLRDPAVRESINVAGAYVAAAMEKAEISFGS